jgi:3-oxoacyl-[acyl-carrier-protein] synthase II
LARRVVVTGIGMLCGVGNTAPEVWNNLLAGKSGMAPITSFDTTGFPVTFAAEVKGFNPLDFMDKKEARKMGRFIHFALAASHEALLHSGLKIDSTNAERVGVHIGSGIGGFDVSTVPCSTADRVRFHRFLFQRPSPISRPAR